MLIPRTTAGFSARAVGEPARDESIGADRERLGAVLKPQISRDPIAVEERMEVARRIVRHTNDLTRVVDGVGHVVAPNAWIEILHRSVAVEKGASIAVADHLAARVQATGVTPIGAERAQIGDGVGGPECRRGKRKRKCDKAKTQAGMRATRQIATADETSQRSHSEYAR